MLIGSLFFVNHHYVGAIVGLVIVALGAWMWALEGPGGYHIHLKPQGQDGHGSAKH